MSKIMNRVLRDVKVIFKNFTGEKGMYNDKGLREFTLVLPEDLALEMKDEGWNVKKKEFDDGYEYRLHVTVSYTYKPPSVYIVNEYGKRLLGEDEIKQLDHADIKKWDVTINPYNWKFGNDSGVKAYLKTMYATQDEDELDQYYKDVKQPDQQTPEVDDLSAFKAVDGDDDIPF